jgi:quinolinate synthase
LEKGGKGGFKIFFFPDEHLGRNTANAKGFKREDMVVWDPYNPPTPPLLKGGISESPPLEKGGEGGFETPSPDLAHAKVILWKGHCHVHTYFTVENIKAAREKYPGCLIAVHPECTEDVVKASDANGSTSFLKKYAEHAPEGSTVIIGTEINMVSRLAKQNPDKRILPLARSLCPNMFKTSLADLCYTLENLPNVNEITVPKYIIDDAKIALERMLSLT